MNKGGYTPKPIIGGDKKNMEFFNTRDEKIRKASSAGSSQTFNNTLTTLANSASSLTNNIVGTTTGNFNGRRQYSSSRQMNNKSVTKVIAIMIAFSVVSTILRMVFSIVGEIDTGPTTYNTPVITSSPYTNNYYRLTDLTRFGISARSYQILNNRLVIDLDSGVIDGSFVHDRVDQSCPVLESSTALYYLGLCNETTSGMISPSGYEYSVEFAQDLANVGIYDAKDNYEQEESILIFTHAKCDTALSSLIGMQDNSAAAVIVGEENVIYCVNIGS